MIEEIRSTDPLVDGTNLTINPEIRYRRKRIVSDQSYPTKRVHTIEFINACRFLAEETNKPYQLSAQHAQILSLIRNNNSRSIPKNYTSVINNNENIVLKAAMLTPKQIKEKYRVAIDSIRNLEEENVNNINTFNNRLEDLSKQKQYVDNPIQQKHTVKDSAIKININNIKKEKIEMSKKSKVLNEQTKKDFEQYLHYRVGEADIPKTTSVTKSRFSNNVGSYLRGKKSYCNADLRKIMDENPDIMGKLLYARQIRAKKTDKIVVKTPKALPSEISSIKIAENQTLHATKTTNSTWQSTETQKETANSILIDLIKALKMTGLSEITLKF